MTKYEFQSLLPPPPPPPPCPLHPLPVSPQLCLTSSLWVFELSPFSRWRQGYTSPWMGKAISIHRWVPGWMGEWALVSSRWVAWEELLSGVTQEACSAAALVCLSSCWFLCSFLYNRFLVIEPVGAMYLILTWRQSSHISVVYSIVHIIDLIQPILE